MTNLALTKFSAINLANPFFDSLKADYKEFPAWFKKKADQGESAYLYKTKKLVGFLYVKVEDGEVQDIDPPLKNGVHLKVGTMKIEAHGTKLGERFIKKIFDHAFEVKADDAYVTVFAKHESLIDLYTRYGFEPYAVKNGPNGQEMVLLKSFHSVKNDILFDYPRIQPDDVTIGLLAIYPAYHSKFLPDSILKTEHFSILDDVSHANSIHKIYLSGIPATGKLKRGDLLVMYRTSDGKGPALYRSVATSIGVVEETRRIKSFVTLSEFMKYARPYSIFSNEELETMYATKKHYTMIKFTYNIALRRRLIRKRLIEDVGLTAGLRRWDFFKLTRQQFDLILEMGQVHESYLID
ncbi:N-acetyltransferase [Comamonas testosteroni]|uniref:N-acetyltransferase n=1 Tax=Comamonas testosteroni TaxID=285 RepID=UPI0039196ECF